MSIDRKKGHAGVPVGKNVYPAEIERVIREIPQVNEVSVVGIPDNKWGRSSLARLSGKFKAANFPNRPLSPIAVKKLAGYKVPKSIIFLEDLPKNTIRKGF